MTAAKILVFTVVDGSHSGMRTGQYCVWLWATGDAELMFRPIVSARWRGPIAVTRIEEQTDD